MKQAVEVFDAYGAREELEQHLNAWLHAQERQIIGVDITALRLFIQWRPAVVNPRTDGLSVNLFKPLPNGESPRDQFAKFFQQHPDARVAFRASNDYFVFWFWCDDTD